MRRKLWGKIYVWEQWVSVFPILIPIVLLLIILPVAYRSTKEAARQSTMHPETTALSTVAAAAEKTVFQSPLAGQWYDADKDKLAAEIDGYLGKVETAPLENVQALIAPHAGYRYSGQVAAYSYKQIAGKPYKRVVVMGPSHHLPMEDVASVPDVTHYATVLGEVPLDVEFIAALKQHPQFKTIHGADDQEHSVQIQIPFLQRTLHDFKLVPIVVGQIDARTTAEMAKILAGLIDPETLVVASSDFTHYGPNYGYQPFKDDIENNLKKLDMGAWECIQKKDGDAFRRYLEETRDTICGHCPIGLLLAMLPPESQPNLIKYDTSGRITGDTTNSVSYLAIAFTGAWKKSEPAPVKPVASATLTEEDKGQLLTLARATLESAVKTGKEPTPEALGIRITPAMSQVMGAFVTLNEHRELRGCIGDIFPSRSLYKAVIDNAVNAGLHDPRFRPVQESELPLLHFEISALTEPVPVASYKDIVIGKHGMLLSKNGRRAVFLPQVAPEQGWGLEETLTHLSQKAGLPPDAWKEGASYQVFEAIVFGEKEKQ